MLLSDQFDKVSSQGDFGIMLEPLWRFGDGC